MTSIDGLCTAALDIATLRDVLRSVTGAADRDILVSPEDRVDDLLDHDRPDPYRVFCVFDSCAGDFSSTFGIGIDAELAPGRDLDPYGLAAALAERTHGEVLCGLGDEPAPWLWTLCGPGGIRRLVHLAEDDDEDLTSCLCPHLHRSVTYQ